MRPSAIASSSVLVAGLTAGCSFGSLDKLTPPHDTETRSLEVRLDRDVDLLFLVDNSPSMADKQANLAANFPKLIDTLSAQGGLPSLRIGVATSDLGTLGTNGMIGPGIGTLGQGGCSGRGDNGALQIGTAPITGAPFLSDVELADGTRQRNYTGALSDVFATMAKAGAGGCGFEQTLESMKRALDPGNTANRGFVRPDAALAVVIITDEDDCSLVDPGLLITSEVTLGPQQSFRCTRYGITCDTGGATSDDMNTIGPKAGCHPAAPSPYLTDVAGYAAFLRQLKPDPSRLVVAGIMGPSDQVAVELRAPPRTTVKIPALAHSCAYVGGDGSEEVADPAVRIAALLAQFPNHQAFESICQQDVSAGLAQVADLLKETTGDACLSGALIDFDPNTEGAQHDCEVTVTAGDGPHALPRCAPEDDTAGNAPCWHLATDAARCPAGEHAEVVIEGVGLLPSGSHVTAGCAVAPASAPAR